MNWEDIVKAPQKRGSFGIRVSDGKRGIISEKNEATWLLQKLVEQGANVEEIIDEFIVNHELDEKETKQLENILQDYLQAHEKAHNQIVNMDWKVDTKKYPKDKFLKDNAGEITMSWENQIRKMSDSKKMDFIIKILETFKDDFENSGIKDGAMRQATKMVAEAITYSKEIKEKLQ